MARLFLALIGLAYIGLAVWCIVEPSGTSQSVGFSLSPGQGQSEFLTVYGGLQFALGIVFLRPIIDREAMMFTLQACVVVHACLVLARSLGFVLFADFSSTTYVLAVVEWAILLAAVAVWRRERTRSLVA